jgi:hypothetical protein
MFTPNDIRTRIKKQPFVPLRIIESSGEHYDIYHPDLIMVGQRHVVVGTASDENPTIFDRSTLLSILHISAIEDLSTPAGQKPEESDGHHP